MIDVKAYTSAGNYAAAEYYRDRYIQTGNEMHRVRAVRWQKIAKWQSLMLRLERGMEQ